MRILSATTIWLLVSGAPADQAACRPFIPVARAAIGEVLAKQGVPLPVPWLDQEVVWAAGLDQRDPTRCAIGWGGNPTGGGYHGGILIERASGHVLDVVIGMHLR
jgi:hypothetical protein